MEVEEAMRIVRRPYVTEKVFSLIEKQNTLAFIVDERANKRAIAQAIETLYKVKILAVNTARTVYGKKAYVKLAPEHSATDLASKMGLV